MPQAHTQFFKQERPESQLSMGADFDGFSYQYDWIDDSEIPIDPAILPASSEPLETESTPVNPSAPGADSSTPNTVPTAPASVAAASAVAHVAEMATGLATKSSNKIRTAHTTSTGIPLKCAVCPEVPNFSDLSHLLTHISSKGHLHHETQTKLRAHHDLTAAVRLRDYEQWYQDHHIEGLLVERMKAKAVKEARNRQPNSRTGRGGPKTKSKKKKTKRSTSRNAVIKVESDGMTPENPLYPTLASSEQESDTPEDGNEALSLKGTVWPGIGKMDLANEEMKRTRNQRKPKSTIDKMKRISQGIEPVQMVMTPDWEVQRFKNVYDESESPGPEPDEPASPPKVPKQRRRKPEAQIDVPPNGPRNRRPNTRSTTRRIETQQSFNSDSHASAVHNSSGYRQSQDIFGAGSSNGPYDTRTFELIPEHEQRFELRNRISMPTLNPISHSNMASPTPTSRAMPTRTHTGPDPNRERSQNYTWSRFAPIDSPYSPVDDNLAYPNHNHSPYGASSHFDGNFHLSSENPVQAHQESQSNGTVQENQYLNMSGTNPLFSHDRVFMYGQSSADTTLASLAFTPINQTTGTETAQSDERQRNGTGSMETSDGIWHPRAPGADMDLHDDLDSGF